jgi:hypothetical protein
MNDQNPVLMLEELIEKTLDFLRDMKQLDKLIELKGPQAALEMINRN